VRILLAGSVATDELMTFPGRFAEQIVPEQLSRLSLSFLTDELVVRRGGVAANIAFGMASLGLQPRLVAAVGADFDTGGYRDWLAERGVDTSPVLVSTKRHTARFVCTTDLDQCQIASFYAGAMLEARDIDIAALLATADLLVVSPDDEEAMVGHTAAARAAGVPFMADTSQQLAHLNDRDRVRSLVDGAAYLVHNDYEKTLLETKAGWTDAEVLSRVGVRITTLGAEGAVAERLGAPPVRVAAAPELVKADPTGVGDALRAGLLAGLSWGLPLERCLQVGATLATLVLETVGTQEYDVAGFGARLAAAYGPEASADVLPHLPALAR
jgi:adenosine kinase